MGNKILTTVATASDDQKGVSIQNVYRGETMTTLDSPTANVEFPLEEGEGLMYYMNIQIACSSAEPSSVGTGGAFDIFAGVKSAGLNATLVGTPDIRKILDTVISDATVALSTTGNTLVVNVDQGSTNFLDWQIQINYVLAG